MYVFARSSPFLIFLGGLCYYLALPPVNFAPLALAVPIFWGIAIRRRSTVGGGRRAAAERQRHRWYAVAKMHSLLSAACRLPPAAYFTSFAFWLASIWWIACPHPLTALGLVALSAFLSLYWLLFFTAARAAVHRFRIPLLIAMPICWIGTEYLRCHILGGFSFCALEHAVYLHPEFIQFASIGGSAVIGGVIMFIGGGAVDYFYLQSFSEKGRLCLFLVYGLGFSAVLAPLHSVLDSERKRWAREHEKNSTVFFIAALQGNRQVYLNSTLDEANENFIQFRDLTYQEIDKRKQNGDPLPDVIIFPETVCPVSVLEFEGSVKPADLGGTEEEVMAWERHFRKFTQDIGTSVILGLSTFIFKDEPDNPIRLNSALLVQPTPISPDSSLLIPASTMYRYDKMHLVMFGEYIPFTEYLPDDFFLKTLCPEARYGTKPAAFPLMKAGIATTESSRIEASVNICFESTVAHLIRNQIMTLRKEGHDPRLLINMSNDGWFRNSHQMEQHLATHVFRAVENRMWYVTSTNGGYSAIIDPYGGIQKMGKRGEAEAVSGMVYLKLDKPHSLTIYQKYGDWYALPLAMGVLFLAGFSFWERRQNHECVLPQSAKSK